MLDDVIKLLRNEIAVCRIVLACRRTIIAGGEEGKGECENGEDAIPLIFHVSSIRIVLGSDLSVAEQNPFVSAKAFDAHRTASVNFIGRNSHFCTEPVNATVGKTRTCVHHNA